MKQEIISYISTIKEDLFSLTKYLYENPEESFSEYKAYSRIVTMLKQHDFRVTEHYLQIATSFYAEKGSGHPKICFFCEYDATPQGGHIAGHNLISTMSLGAALSLGKVIEKIGGTVVILGCPGEFKNGAKVIMAKQGTFEDIDAGLMVHPDVDTCESGTSMAVLPMQIKYKSKEGFAYRRVNTYSALDACLFTFNALNLLSKGFEEGSTIDGVIINGGSAPYMLPTESDSKLYIRAPKMKVAENIENNIKEFVKTTSRIMDVEYETSLYELPYDELIPNPILSRIFAHNLKEIGIIDICGPQNTRSGLSLGSVSHLIPCIHPLISIVEDKTISYASREFAEATVSNFAQERAIKCAQALAITGLDLIENRALLSDVKSELQRQNDK